VKNHFKVEASVMVLLVAIRVNVLVALLAVAKAFVNFTRHGPPLDKDGPWHVFMLSMFVQLPIILYFIFEYRRALRRGLPVLATQLSLWGLSMGAACYSPGIY
jgi:hypothetical protein